jgi:hypothetical protein
MLTLGKNIWHNDPDFPHPEVNEVYLTDDARKQGTYVIGTTGTGKTTLLLNLILKDIESGEGVCVLDPHGDFIHDIMARVPDERLDDIILFDPADDKYPLGLNLLECNDKNDPRERDLVVSTIIETLHRLFADSWGPRMEDLLRHTILSLLLHDEPTTLIHMMMVMVNYYHRQRLTANARKLDPILKAYWEDEFPESKRGRGGGLRKPREQSELVSSSLNKIGRFITNPVIRNIVGQPKSAFKLRDIMDEGKVLLVNLSKGDVGADNARLLGAVLVNQLLVAALSRRSIPQEKRKPFHLYVDEYQNFATKAFPDLQSEARKYGIDTLVAHQYRDQLDEDNQGSSLNVANMICLRVSGKDAGELAGQFENRPGMNELELKMSPMPVDRDGRFFIQQKLDTGEGLFEFAPSKLRMYSDVEMETANILAQLPNYQAIVRVLEKKPNPKNLHQFRIGLFPAPNVDPTVVERRINHIRQKARERATFTSEQITDYIREYMDSAIPDGEDQIPFY